ncbi:MAG TPA: HAMP domain-containing protein, partial [Candidatus Omnitrophota bacterium]|nr:HAMP domain-containing protein [Candidatus Omnitrophota bacterium]
MTNLHFSLWKRIQLRHKFIVVAAMFTAVLAGLIAFNVWVVNGQKDNTVVADLAGRQRMLSQKYMKEVILAAQGMASDHDGTLKLMRETQSVLADGGSALLSVEGGQRADLAGAPNAEIRAKLTEQGNLIRQLETEAGRYLALSANDGRRAEKLRELLAIQGQLSQVADQVVKAYTRETEAMIGRAVALQVAVGIIGALAGMIISWGISVQIVNPLAACAEAALQIAKGNLRLDPQRITSGDELGLLQRAFNEMLASLREIAFQSREVCDNLTLAAAQILASTQEQAAGTKQQAAAVQEITTTVE